MDYILSLKKWTLYKIKISDSPNIYMFLKEQIDSISLNKWTAMCIIY